MYGKRVKCAQCGQAFQIPTPGEGATPSPVVPAYAPPPGRSAVRRPASDPAGWWRYAHLIAFGLPVLLMLVGRLSPPVLAAGILLGSLIGIVMLIWGQIGILITAGQEGAACVLMYLFLPVYPLYYVISRFDDVKSHLGRAVGGVALMVFAAMSIPPAA